MFPVRLELVRHMYAPDKDQFTVPVNTHDEFWIMFVPESGKFEWSIGNEKGEASFGDCVLCPPGIPFHRRVIERLNYHFFSFYWHSHQEKIDAQGDLPALLHINDTARLYSTLLYLRKVSLPTESLVLSRKTQLLTDLLQHGFLEQFETRKTKGRKGDAQMDQALQFVETNAFSEFNFGDIAKSLGMGNMTFSRRFRSAFGQTPIDFLTNLRLKKACELLESSDKSLDVIAKECGYSSGFYLSRVFVKRLRVRPSIYRQTHQV
jgi:AraC family transcriptional regulator